MIPLSIYTARALCPRGFQVGQVLCHILFYEFSLERDNRQAALNAATACHKVLLIYNRKRTPIYRFQLLIKSIIDG